MRYLETAGSEEATAVRAAQANIDNDGAFRSGEGAHRFIFGNPFLAHPMLQLDTEAATHVPLDCCFVEKTDGSGRMIMMLPSVLTASSAEGVTGETLQLQRKLVKFLRQLVRNEDPFL
jgi:hypothetical protein